MGFLAALFLSFVPAFLCAAVVYWLDRYEKEPRLLLGAVFFWGAVVAVIGALVAQRVLAGAVTAATGSERAADVAGSTLFAPITEESLKGIAILAVFLVLRREFDSMLDGIVYAAIVALGFAATENVFYLYGEFTEQGMEGLLSLFVVRVVLGIWNHPFYTVWIGIGLALSRLSPNLLVRWLAPPLGWAMALGFHSLHNTLATFAESAPGLGLVMFLVDWCGWLSISVLILVSIYREGRLLGTHLAEEVGLGRLTPAQYKTATSSWAQSGARLRTLVGTGRRPTRRFYQVCGELAHKKAQLARLGDEGHNVVLIEKLRAELVVLSGQAIA